MHPGHQLGDRGLAGARGTDERHAFAGGDPQVHVVEDGRAPVAAADLVERRADGLPAVERDYRSRLTRPAEAAIYVQGGTEHTHGISSTLLSNVAIRSGEIVGSVLARDTSPARVG